LTITDPPPDCQICPRLASFRAENRKKHPDWFNGAVPAWGDENPRLIIVGLAPGLQGANRTGRPFTGDYAGDLLYQTLGRAGLSSGTYDARPNDDLMLQHALIVNAVRCVPPQNKPIGAEIASCRQFLRATFDKYAAARIYLALGRIAHDSLLTMFSCKKSVFPFGHGARHALPGGQVLYDSFHCSRYNTNTRRLTTEMFESVVFAAAEEALG
jgi:uracil-DNA glycosylase